MAAVSVPVAAVALYKAAAFVGSAIAGAAALEVAQEALEDDSGGSGGQPPPGGGPGPAGSGAGGPGTAGGRASGTSQAGCRTCSTANSESGEGAASRSGTQSDAAAGADGGGPEDPRCAKLRRKIDQRINAAREPAPGPPKGPKGLKQRFCEAYHGVIPPSQDEKDHFGEIRKEQEQLYEENHELESRGCEVPFQLKRDAAKYASKAFDPTSWAPRRDFKTYCYDMAKRGLEG